MGELESRFKELEMAIQRLEHILVLAQDLDETKNFYVGALGLHVGDRPPFKFAGYWLYLGDTPVIHLALAEGDPALQEYFDEAPLERNTKTGAQSAAEHIAFSATGYDEFVARLEHLNVPHKKITVPLDGTRQIFVHDPNGLKLEINFAAASE